MIALNPVPGAYPGVGKGRGTNRQSVRWFEKYS